MSIPIGFDNNPITRIQVSPLAMCRRNVVPIGLSEPLGIAATISDFGPHFLRLDSSHFPSWKPLFGFDLGGFTLEPGH
jgi:hypothetical protein